MKRVLIAIASLAAVVFVVGVMAGGLYLRSLRTSAVAEPADVSPSPSDTPLSSPTPIEEPSPSPTPVLSPIVLPSGTAPKPTFVPPAVPPTCPAEVITSFTATASGNAVVLRWTVSGGCGDETGWYQGSFSGTMYGPGLWVVPLHIAWKTYTDHPKKPANSEGVCLFTLDYWIDFNGSAPDGRGVPAVHAEATNVNLC